MHPYPDYTPLPVVSNDILVFKVKQPFLLTPSVQVVKLAKQGFEPIGNILKDYKTIN
jgi:hypothetical protein